MTDKKDDKSPEPQAGATLSRRSLLASTAGLTFAGAVGGTAMAQEAANTAAGQHASHLSHGATSLSSRLYQVNPGMPEHSDIAHDPADTCRQVASLQATLRHTPGARRYRYPIAATEP